MPLNRVENWDTRALHDFLRDRATAPFVWGKNDCCLFPADGILAMTGVDIAKPFRGGYADKVSAFALLKKLTGGSTVADAAAWCAGRAGLLEYSKPLFASRGDLVVMRNADGEVIAGLVHLNGRHLVTVAETGLVRVPLSALLRAWKV